MMATRVYLDRHGKPLAFYGVGVCTAYWAREGEIDPLADVTHSSVYSYVDSNPENFPQNWPEEDISGFEIVVDTLRFEVSADDS